MSAARISIVVPTKNGRATLPALLDALARQRTGLRVEIVAVDSASTDGTADLLRGRVDRLIEIGTDAFDHGLTRNAGVEAAAGELVVLLVQDAVPASDVWLSELTAPLLSDPGLAGTFARQRPAPGASPITRHYLENWAGASAVARVAGISGPAEFEALSPLARFERCVFDNVCSCIRRSVWLEHPFRPTPIAEDLEWAKEVLLAGHQLAYVPTAEVMHSHERSACYEFARTYVLHRRLYELFGLQTIPTVPALTRAIASSIGLHMKKEPGALKGVPLAFAWPLGQYLGARSAINGWKTHRLGRV